MLSLRLLRNTWRHPMLVLLNFVATAVAALCLGAIYFDLGSDMAGIQNRFGCLFFILLFQSVMSLSSLPIWREQYRLFLQERDDGVYKTLSYFVAVALFDLVPLRMLPPSFFAFFTYWMAGFRTDYVSSIGYFLLILVLSNVAAALLCVAVGVASPSNRVAIVVASALVLLWGLFGSFMVSPASLPPYLSWISYTSYIHYAFEALVVNEFAGDDVGYLLTTGVPDTPPMQVTGTRVLTFFSYDPDWFALDLGMLGVLAAVFGCLSYAFLAIKSCSRLRVSSSSRSSGTSTVLDLRHVDSQLFAHGGSYSELRDAKGVVGKTQGQGEAHPPPSGSAGLSRANLSWRVHSYHLGSRRAAGKVILSGVHGCVGRAFDADRSPLLGLMGPSGAGKTTLLDVLAGRLKRGVVQGDIRLNGARAAPDAVRRASGYVPQEDVLPGTATVWEHLLFHAVLRMPRARTLEEKKARAWQVVLQLGLQKVVDSLIGDEFVRGLSGGEKRRLSIGVELLMCPGLMFLDEPTTGLDSSNAAKVVDILAELSHEAGMSVVLSIHQPRPDVLRTLGRVLLLSSTGQMVFSGPCEALEAHVAGLGYERPPKVNAVDFLLDVVIKAGKEEAEALVSGFRKSEAFSREEDAMDTAHASRMAPSPRGGDYSKGGRQCRSASGLPRFGTEFRMLSLRLLRNTWRHPFLITLNFALNLVAAVGVGIFYWGSGYDTPGIQNRLGTLFFILLFLSIMSLSSLPVWQSDRRLFLREVGSGSYGAFSYFLAMVVFDMLVMRVLPIFMFAATYEMVGLWSQPPSRLGWFLLVIMLMNLCASSVCMCVGAATRSAAMANMVGSFVVLAQLLFGGFLLNNTQLPPYVEWLQWVSYIKYAYEALAINEFAGHGYTFTAPEDENLWLDAQGEEVLLTFGLDPTAFRFDVGMLGVLTFAGLFGCLLALLVGARSARY